MCAWIGGGGGGFTLKCVCPLGWGLVLRTDMPIKDNSTIPTESMEREKGREQVTATEENVKE